MSAKDVREFLYTNLKAQNANKPDSAGTRDSFEGSFDIDADNDDIDARDFKPAPAARPYFSTDTSSVSMRQLEEQRDNRVLLLLNQLGERLIRSERERLELKETVGRYADLINALEHKIDKQTLAEESLRERQERLERDYEAQMQKMQKAIVLAERIEEAIHQQNRLARRIEQITQDKARMLRKLERIEEAVVETQAALNSKSLALVGEQNRAVNDPSATIPPAANQNALLSPSSWRRLVSSVAVVALITGLSWGVYQSLPTHNTPARPAVSSEELLATPPFNVTDAEDVRDLAQPYTNENVDIPVTENLFAEQEADVATEENLPANDNQPVTATPQVEDNFAQDAAEEAADEIVTPADIRTPSPVALPDENILAKSDDELVALLNDDPDALANALNNIAPGAAAVPSAIAKAAPQTPATPAISKAANDDRQMVEDFLRGQRDSRPLSARIQPDNALPADIKQIEQKAFEGVPEAQHDLAAIYTAGHGGVKTNFAQAALWFEEAALNGISNARYNLGVLYHQGLGVSQDTTKAVNWYKAAALQGHPEAQYNLGIAYIEGVGTEYNPQSASQNFENAANAGILEASYNLGLIHENGLLGSPQIDQAIYWYSKAAEQGSPEGKAALNQLARNMGYSESRVQDIYKSVKARLDGQAAPKKAAVSTSAPASAPAAAPIKATPASTTTTATAPIKADSIPVLPLDAPVSGALQESAKEAAKPATRTETSASTSTRDARIIAQIQEQLVFQGLYPGPVDGGYNDVMADAIRSYQKMYNLSQDGRASQALLVHMMAQESAAQTE